MPVFRTRKIYSKDVVDGEIVDADISATASIAITKTRQAYGIASSPALSVTIAHGLGVVPIIYDLTQISSAFLATQIYQAGINASALVVAVNVSGAAFQWNVQAS